MATTTLQRSSIDEIIDLLKQDLDMSSIDESLKLTTEQRFVKFLSLMQLLEGLQQAGKRSRGEA